MKYPDGIPIRAISEGKEIDSPFLTVEDLKEDRVLRYRQYISECISSLYYNVEKFLADSFYNN